MMPINDSTNLPPEWRALQKAAPEIADHAWRLHQVHPILNGRAYRAGLLAAGDGVTRIDDAMYTVKSQAGDGEYTVILRGQGLRWASCTCVDWLMGTCSNGRGAPRTRHQATPRCKHVLAVAMSPEYKASINGGTR